MARFRFYCLDHSDTDPTQHDLYTDAHQAAQRHIESHHAHDKRKRNPVHVTPTT